MLVILKHLGLLMQVATELEVVEASLSAGAPVTAPSILTYLGKQHVKVDITVTPIP